MVANQYNFSKNQHNQQHWLGGLWLLINLIQRFFENLLLKITYYWPNIHNWIFQICDICPNFQVFSSNFSDIGYLLNEYHAKNVWRKKYFNSNLCPKLVDQSFIVKISDPKMKIQHPNIMVSRFAWHWACQWTDRCSNTAAFSAVFLSQNLKMFLENLDMCHGPELAHWPGTWAFGSDYRYFTTSEHCIGSVFSWIVENTEKTGALYRFVEGISNAFLGSCESFVTCWLECWSGSFWHATNLWCC